MTAPAQLLKRLAVVVALGMLAYRFMNFELVPFINDEPVFLAAAHAQLGTGHWLTASPLQGTQGATYGPSVLWFYGGVQALFGEAPRTSILVMCLLVTLAHLGLVVSLTRLFRGDALLLAALVALVAASPYQFFWSRLAWDQLVNVCACWTVVLLSLPGPWGWRRAVGLGAVLGVAVSSHLMVLPLVGLTFAVLGLEQLRRPRMLALTLGLTLGVAVSINLPYLGFLRAHPPPPLPAAGPFSWELLGEHLIQPARVATAWGLGYFFDHTWGDFLAWVGGAGGWLVEHSGWSVALLLALSAVGLGSHLRAEDVAQRRVARLALAVWLAYGVFYTLRGLNREPHYQFPTGWVVAAGVAGTLHLLRGRSVRWGTVATAAVLAGAMAQFLVSVAWMHYIREHGGTQGIHYSTPLAAQQQALSRACQEAAGGVVVLENRTVLFPHSLGYVAHTTPACQGVRLLLCGPGGCPPGAGFRRLSYAAPTGGALLLEQ